MSEPQQSRPIDFDAGPNVAGKVCSICQTNIITGEKVVECPYCALPFHGECWDENRGCSAYGCQGAPKTVKAEAEPQPVSNAWGDEKPCPACGKTIKASAIKCRFCGAAFDSRDIIDQKQYASREYDGTEYNAVRNKTIFLFLLSAAACLAPVGLILNLVLIYSGGIMGMQFKRMPAALKAVVYCATGVSAILIVIMLLLITLDH